MAADGAPNIKLSAQRPYTLATGGSSVCSRQYLCCESSLRASGARWLPPQGRVPRQAPLYQPFG